jgi:hypothetical protein
MGVAPESTPDKILDFKSWITEFTIAQFSEDT